MHNFLCNKPVQHSFACTRCTNLYPWIQVSWNVMLCHWVSEWFQTFCSIMLSSPSRVSRPGTWRQYVLLKCCEPLTPHNSVTSWTAWILCDTSVRTSNNAKQCFSICRPFLECKSFFILQILQSIMVNLCLGRNFWLPEPIKTYKMRSNGK
jgi:hypothetical protein